MVTDTKNELRVLVVDDDEDAVGALVTMMRLEGHAVVCSSNGVDALKVEAEFSPHVIFLDLEMPGLNGFEVATEIRRRQRTSQQRIYLVTGIDDVSPYEKAGSPFDKVFTKPMDISILLAHVRPHRVP